MPATPDPAGMPHFSGTSFDVVALVASTGGIPAIIHILAELPEDFPAAILIVQHMERGRRSALAGIMAVQSLRKVKEAEEGDRLQSGMAYLAAPDRHLVVDGSGVISLLQTPLVHWVRPAADPLLASLASSFGERALAVILSGRGRDGASGMVSMRVGNGITIAQADGLGVEFGMPGSSIATGSMDMVLPLEEIAPTLVRLITDPAAGQRIRDDRDPA